MTRSEVRTSHGIMTTSILTLRTAENVVVDIWIPIKKSMTVAKNIRTA